MVHLICKGLIEHKLFSHDLDFKLSLKYIVSLILKAKSTNHKG